MMLSDNHAPWDVLVGMLFLFVFFSVKKSGDVFCVGGLGDMRFMAS